MLNVGGRVVLLRYVDRDKGAPRGEDRGGLGWRGGQGIGVSVIVALVFFMEGKRVCKEGGRPADESVWMN